MRLAMWLGWGNDEYIQSFGVKILWKVVYAEG
jgi:hypothetical protein